MSVAGSWGTTTFMICLFLPWFIQLATLKQVLNAQPRISEMDLKLMPAWVKKQITELYESSNPVSIPLDNLFYVSCSH